MVAGPIVEQFIARVVEYQFGDQMFNFLAPWREEQQLGFQQALERHITQVALTDLQHLLDTLDGEAMASLETWIEQCQTT